MAASNGELIDEINRREAKRSLAMHEPPCAHLRALLWFIGIGLVVAMSVIGANCAMVNAATERQERNTGDIRELRTDIKYIRESLARIESNLPHP